MKNFSKFKIDYQKIYWAVMVLVSLSALFSFRGFVKYILLWCIQLGLPNFSIPLLIGDPLSIPYFIEPIFAFSLFIVTWILSTKIKKLQEIKYRYIVFGITFLGMTFQYLWTCSTPVVRTLIPYLYFKKEMLFVPNYEVQAAVVHNFDNLMLFILSFPLIFLLLTYYWLFKLVNAHWEEIIQLFKTWEYNISLPSIAEVFLSNDKQRKIASEISEQFKDKSKILIPEPDVELGPNKKNVMVVIPGLDRTLNMIIIGSIGAGKTAALGLPLINQDLHYMTFMINNFKRFYNDKNYVSEEIRGKLLNGITVIEPSNDLCQKVLRLAKAHGIPDEAITYIDPTNPDTPSLNILNGPVDKVAEMFAMVISGLSKDADFFFDQSQRTHLKNHIYLLMEHNPEKNVDLSDLIDMYNDAQLVWRMMQKLEDRIPKDIDSIEDRDSKNYWKIMQSVKEWFDKAYVIATSGFGKNMTTEYVQSGKYQGEYKIIDTKTEHVVGLRNILDDIGKNILMRRVLFDKSDFDFDKFLEYGGILLINTAKGQLSNLSNVLGKFSLLCYQNAVFRRPPMTSSYNALYCDEFPDYIYEEFAQFPAQSRKYKSMVNVICQTTAQLELEYGEPWKETLLAALRNKMLYGDATKKDATDFSTIFGAKEIFEESESTQEVSAMMDSPNNRTGLSYKKTETEVLSISDIIYQDAFECAVKIVKDNKPIPGQIIKANFVPKHEFEEATVKVDEEAAQYWMKIRKEAPSRKNFEIKTASEEIIKENTSELKAEPTPSIQPNHNNDELSKVMANIQQKSLHSMKIDFESSKKKKKNRYIHQQNSPHKEIVWNEVEPVDNVANEPYIIDQSAITKQKKEVNTVEDAPLVTHKQITSDTPFTGDGPLAESLVQSIGELPTINPEENNTVVSFESLFGDPPNQQDNDESLKSDELTVTTASNSVVGVIEDSSVLNNELLKEWEDSLK
ncbi:conjugal transfer protein TraG [Bacillus cereus]|uniref:Conjugal transfer protein TraG n=1 Tax=Bacillus cereus TaxID=1396 RepID=A0A9W7UNQ4_BACCE|nr:TraM recognition domain-containing protein [Bacillus cereus]KAA6449247.1 conjugal transfer protein TraG [Bacillus cereus]